MIKTTGAGINIDCREPLKLCEFYRKLTGWVQGSDEYGLLTDTGMTVYFLGCDFDYIPPVFPEQELIATIFPIKRKLPAKLHHFLERQPGGA